MTPPVPDVSLTIVSYNTADLLRACLASIAAIGPGLSVQTIVVDNASADGSADMVARDFPWVELVRNPTNRYFAPAHNQAFPLARGRYVGILNPDTQLFPDTLHRMTAFMDAHPEAGVSTCRFARTDGTPLNADAHNYWRFHSLWYMVLCRNGLGERVYYALGGRRSEPIRSEGDIIETDVVTGAFLFVRKAALDRVVGFDPRLLMYGTEDDLCASIKQIGYRVYFYQGAQLLHAVSASVRRSNPFWIRWLFAVDLMRYQRKHGTATSRWLGVPVLFAAYLVDAAVILSRGGKWK